MKIIILFIVSFLLIITVFSCSKLDVIGSYSITTFNNLINTKKLSTNNVDNYWEIKSEDGEIFGISIDFSNQNADFYLKLNALNFIKSGLDPSKLPKEKYIFGKKDNTITLNFEISSDKFKKSSNVLDTYKEIVKYNRDIIGYHEELDHYGIALGNGNMFEWAKELNKNDKDLVFVLNPDDFIIAGLDVTKLDTWVFGKVRIKDSTGNKVEVDKLLRPYNLQ